MFKNQSKIILGIFITILGGFFAYNALSPAVPKLINVLPGLAPEPVPSDPGLRPEPIPTKHPVSESPYDKCVQMGGLFIDEPLECEGHPNLSRTLCEQNGGKFISCASPCRHAKPGTMCTDVCLNVCQF